jgi:(S)-ureidoglycine aminohydrolase
MHELGHTRSAVRRDHFFLAADTFVRAAFPGIEKGVAIIHVAPTTGAAFTQYTVELEKGGSLRDCGFQRFFYVLHGEATFSIGGKEHGLRVGSYGYAPADAAHKLIASQACRIAVIEKPYVPADGVGRPEMFVGHEPEITPTHLYGDPHLEVRAMVPDNPAFDFAVNTMTYQPGAALAHVEIHVMEHGLLMLEGGGIYRLGDSWYPTKAGDFIWMATYCPQWFGALGKTQSKYLIYKDWNRHPL